MMKKMMKKMMKLMMSAMFVAAFCMTACNRENEGGGNDNGGGGGGNGNQQEYPATANVIRNAVEDIDGNQYDAVRIGSQVWMAENLKTTRYADGTVIPKCEDNIYTSPCRVCPGNNENYVEDYGYLYNWFTVMHGETSSDDNPSGVQGICPAGWHVPSDAEWTELTSYMSGESMYWAGGNPDHLAKALAATWGWSSNTIPGTPGNDQITNNASGFSAVPAGRFLLQEDGDTFGNYAYFWSSTMGGALAYYRYLSEQTPNVLSAKYGRDHFFSVRCVRN